MSKLILSLDGAVIQEFTLGKDRFTIGRKPHNNVHIDNLAVSGEHAVITTILNDTFIEDKDSTNGTLVNGSPIKRHILQDGDLIEIGKYRLKFICERMAKPAAESADFEKTMVIRSPMATKPVSPGDTPAGTQTFNPERTGVTQPLGASTVAVEPKAAPAPQGPRAAAIQLLNGANAGKELELTKSLTSLGKPGVQVAVIAKRPHGYFITHVQGDSFPVVNGRQLDAQAHELMDHDVIELAGIKMEFFYK